jgi:hypothetical protein
MVAAAGRGDLAEVQRVLWMLFMCADMDVADKDVRGLETCVRCSVSQAPHVCTFPDSPRLVCVTTTTSLFMGTCMRVTMDPIAAVVSCQQSHDLMPPGNVCAQFNLKFYPRTQTFLIDPRVVPYRSIEPIHVLLGAESMCSCTIRYVMLSSAQLIK